MTTAKDKQDNYFNILWMRERFSWMGKYSGYDNLCSEIDKLSFVKSQSVFRKFDRKHPDIIFKILKTLARVISPYASYNENSILPEVSAIFKHLKYKPQLVHATFAENNLGIIPRLKYLFPSKIVGTVHMPCSWWKERKYSPELLSNLDALIVLSKSEIDFFNEYLPGRVFQIPHGINTAFFCNDDESKEKNNKYYFIFCGFWLRDIDTLKSVIKKVTAHRKDIYFDLVVPEHELQKPIFNSIKNLKQVTFYYGLTDEELKRLYRRGTGLLLPLKDSTANNALLEAMACGLPVISTDVGGVKEYTDSSFADLFNPGETDEIVNAIFRLANDPREVEKRKLAARAHCVDHYDWSIIVPEILNLYKMLLRY